MTVHRLVIYLRKTKGISLTLNQLTKIIIYIHNENHKIIRNSL